MLILQYKVSTWLVNANLAKFEAQSIIIEMAKIRAASFLEFLLLTRFILSAIDMFVFKPHKTMQSG